MLQTQPFTEHLAFYTDWSTPHSDSLLYSGVKCSMHTAYLEQMVVTAACQQVTAAGVRAGPAGCEIQGPHAFVVRSIAVYHLAGAHVP